MLRGGGERISPLGKGEMRTHSIIFSACPSQSVTVGSLIPFSPGLWAPLSVACWESQLLGTSAPSGLYRGHVFRNHLKSYHWHLQIIPHFYPLHVFLASHQQPGKKAPLLYTVADSSSHCPEDEVFSPIPVLLPCPFSRNSKSKTWCGLNVSPKADVLET